MAESASERLKRILAEKRAAANGQSNSPGSVSKSHDELRESNADLQPTQSANENSSGTAIDPATGNVESESIKDSDSSTPANEVGTSAVTLLDSDPVGYVPGAELVSRHPLEAKIQQLAQMLNEQVPDFAFLLKEIHDKTKKDQDIATALTEEEIGVIVTGLSRHKDITIVAATSKTSKKRTQPVTLDMLE